MLLRYSDHFTRSICCNSRWCDQHGKSPPKWIRDSPCWRLYAYFVLASSCVGLHFTTGNESNASRVSATSRTLTSASAHYFAGAGLQQHRHSYHLYSSQARVYGLSRKSRPSSTYLFLISWSPSSFWKHDSYLLPNLCPTFVFFPPVTTTYLSLFTCRTSIYRLLLTSLGSFATSIASRCE